MEPSDCQNRSDSPSPVVETQYGRVRGVTLQGVHIFRGIPYGGPTEGTGRFLPPSRPAQWAGIYEATRNGPQCVQRPGNIFQDPIIGAYFRGSKDRTELAAQEQSENCLVLYPESEQLSGQIADAWAAFARTGSPSHPGIPEWPAYTADERATMLWDVPQSQIVSAPDLEIRQILQRFPSDRLW